MLKVLRLTSLSPRSVAPDAGEQPEATLKPAAADLLLEAALFGRKIFKSVLAWATVQLRA